MAQSTSLNGIYLDDMESGWTIEDNQFESIHMCMFIGGGRQNVVRGNTFINCTVPVDADGEVIFLVHLLRLRSFLS
jgi:parallel beta-helix repeat protein